MPEEVPLCLPRTNVKEKTTSKLSNGKYFVFLPKNFYKKN